MEDSGGESGFDSDNERESISPVFGFEVDEQGNKRSAWRLLPELEEGGDREDCKGVNVDDGGEKEIAEELGMKQNDQDQVMMECQSQAEEKGRDFVGFSTAGGKAVKVSEVALEQAKQRMEVDGPFDNDNPKGMVTGFMGFSTAKGKPVSVSKEALELAKKKFMECDAAVEAELLQTSLKPVPSSSRAFKAPTPKPKEFSGFSTAAGKAVTVSEKAVREAKGIFEEDLEGDAIMSMVQSQVPGNQPEDDNGSLSKIPELVGFKTAAGKSIQISQEALEQAKKKFKDWNEESEEEDDSMDYSSKSPQPTVAFATASGKVIPISQKALEIAKKSFIWDLEEEDTDKDGNYASSSSSPPRPSTSTACTSKSMPFTGFSSASGKAIKVSEKAIAQAKKLLECEEDEEEPQSPVIDFTSPAPKSVPLLPPKKLEFGGFATAAGKAVSVSEEALQKAKKMFESDDEGDNLLAGVQSQSPSCSKAIPPVGFATAAGNSVQISKKALLEARKKLEWATEEDSAGDDLIAEIHSQSFPTPAKTTTTAEEEEQEISMLTETCLHDDDNDTVDGMEEKSLNVMCSANEFDFDSEQMAELEEEKGEDFQDLIKTLVEDEENEDCWSGNVEEDEVNVELAGIQLNGEVVPFLRLVVIRAYPLLYCWKIGESHRYLSEKAYRQRKKAMALKREALEDKLLPQLEQEIRQKLVKGERPKGKIDWEELTGEEIVAYLNSSEDDSAGHILNQLSRGKRQEVDDAREELEQKIRSMVTEEFTKRLQDLQLEVSAKPVFKLRVVDLHSYNQEDVKCHQGLISIWDPTEEMLNSIKEQQAYEFRMLKPANFQPATNQMVRLSTTRESRIFPVKEVASQLMEDFEVKQSFARRVVTIEEVVMGDFGPLYEEFDVVGRVAVVDAQVVQLEDEMGNGLKIRFWELLSESGLQDILQVGSILACSNIQWRANLGEGTAFAKDVTCFETNPKSELLVKALAEFREAIKDVPVKVAKENVCVVVRTVVPGRGVPREPEPETELSPRRQEQKMRNASKRKLLEQYCGLMARDEELNIPPKRNRSCKFVVPRRVEPQEQDC